LPNFSFEAEGFCTTGSGATAFDANPADIVVDFLTNARYGAGFPAANIASLADYDTYCLATGLLLSPIIDSQQDAGRYLSDIAAVTNSAIVWSGTALKIVPYGDSPVSGNGVVWTPNLVPAYSLDDDDFIPWESADGSGRGISAAGSQDPVIVTRINPADATNWLSVEFTDRGNNYDYAIVAAFDQGAIDQFGLRMEPSIEAHGVCQQAIAFTAATLMLQRRQYIRNTYKFQVGWQYCLLEPMDIVLLTDATLGLAGAPVRITSVEENDDGELTIEAEEIPGVTP
jgi:predicted phage tail protein